MNNSNLYSLNYYLLPTKTSAPGYEKIQHQAFHLWKDVISSALHSVGLSSEKITDEFTRQDLMSVICHESRPIGILLFCFYDFSMISNFEFTYFKENYCSEFFEIARKLHLNRVMSMQYMTISPEWRKANTSKIKISSLLAGLSIKVRDDFNADAGIAPMRRDLKVNELYYDFGATCLVENFVSHNVPCDLVASIRGKTSPHPNPEVNFQIEYLWKKRNSVIHTFPAEIMVG